jgi:hypothetical protein
MSFKQFFNEAAELAYNPPPEKAKFQLGDLVVVRDDGRWKTYQSKKTAPYINSIGEVVGYKNVPGAYTKFALKFSDGNVFLFHSHFLYGPFKDLKTAQKYTDPKIDIKPVDIKPKQGSVTLTEYQKRDNVESFLKTFLPKIGYTLLQTPKEVMSKDGKYIYTVFATMDIEYCKSNQFSHEIVIPGKYSCYRVNGVRTKKLKSAMGNTLNGINGIINFRNSSSGGLNYFIEAPEKNKNDDVNVDSLFALNEFGIPSNPKLLHEESIIEYFNTYKTTIQQIKAGKFNTDLSIVSLFYNVNGDTITGDTLTGSVSYDKVDLKDKNFYNSYKIIGNFNFDVNNGNTDLTRLPREITGDLSVYNWHDDFDSRSLNSLHGIQIVGGDIEVSRVGLKSLAGAPKIINGNFDCGGNNLVNFNGGPEEVKGDFKFFRCKKLTSLSGLPKAKMYEYDGALLNGREVTEKDIQIALLKYKMSPTAKETFGDLMDEL